MEITLVWVQKERCTLIFKSLLEWPGLFDLSFAVSASLSPVYNVFTAKRFCLYCVQDHLFVKLFLYVMSYFVRVAPVMIHGLNVKKHSCGFDSRTNEAAFTLVEKNWCFANIWHDRQIWCTCVNTKICTISNFFISNLSRFQMWF